MKDENGVDRYKAGKVRSLDDLLPDNRNMKGDKSFFVFVFIMIGIATCVAFFVMMSGLRTGELADKIVSAVVGGGNFQQGESQLNGAENNSDDVDESEQKGENEESESAFVPDKNEENIFVETDISQVELGEAYIINETDMSVNVAELIGRGFDGDGPRTDGAPIVLIVHTDATEKYIDYDIPGLYGNADGLQSVASVGDALSARLNNIGIASVYCGAIHGSNNSDAESDTAKTILTMLKIYPSIKYVLDVGRLQLSNSGETAVKTVSASKEASAQISISVSRWGSGDGREDNMAFALQIRKLLNENGERVCAPVRLTSAQGNSALSRYYLKIDIGSEGNSVQEALAAGEELADAIAGVLK